MTDFEPPLSYNIRAAQLEPLNDNAMTDIKGETDTSIALTDYS